MQLNPLQQQQFAQRMNAELEKITMSWNNSLHDWYPLAMTALKYASVLELRIPQGKYADILKTDSHGINMNVVAVLSNNLEARTPEQMKVSPNEWAGILKLNDEVAKDWEALAAPVRRKVLKELEIMAGKEGGLKIIKAEA